METADTEMKNARSKSRAVIARHADAERLDRSEVPLGKLDRH
jgi:hypothetical protein